MKTKQQVVDFILQNKDPSAQNVQGQAFAPSNIALCKYWGKRNTELNLPQTASLSISLADKGANTRIALHDGSNDHISINDETLDPAHPICQRLTQFLNLFRTTPNQFFAIESQSNIPIAAGLASSACGFAALVKALDDLFSWQLPAQHLSILARLGSGSACRSLWPGFVKWQAGVSDDGMDSFAKPLEQQWPELRIGILLISSQAKTISSRKAMQQTVETSQLYQAWPQQVAKDLASLELAIKEKDFVLLGQTAEQNAMAMHATMLSSWPSINYCLAATWQAINQVQSLRADGLPIYFTQDAGPNIKLLFLEKDLQQVQQHFEQVEIVQPFVS